MSEQNESVVVITRGEKAVFDIFLEKDSLPRCVDLTGFTKFKVCLPQENSEDPLVINETPNANGSKTEFVDSGTYGQIKVTLFPTDTKLLKAKFGQDYDIEWDLPAGVAPKRKRIHKGLNVEESICP